jgi:hypothetical protein
MTVKSTISIKNCLSLLTLPTPFQAAVREGKIGVSQGYLLAANLDLDTRKLYEIFQSILEKPVTYEELKRLLESARNAKTVVPKPAFSIFYSGIKAVRTTFEKGKAAYAQQDMETLIAELDAFSALLKEQVRKQAATTAAKAAEASAAGMMEAVTTGGEPVASTTAATNKTAQTKAAAKKKSPA